MNELKILFAPLPLLCLSSPPGATLLLCAQQLHGSGQNSALSNLSKGSTAKTHVDNMIDSI